MSESEGMKSNHRGVTCDACGCPQLRVVYTRRRQGAVLLRRRECVRCRRWITTWERQIHGSGLLPANGS